MGLTTKEISSSSFNDMISSVDRRSEYVENRAGANVRLNNFLTPYTLDDKSSILNAPCGYSNGVYPSLRPVGGENLLVQSNNFNTSWGENAGVSPRTSGQTGYDGTTNAWLLTKNATAFAYMFQDVSTSGLQTYSVYAKANTLSQITLYINASSNNYYGIFNLSNGSFIAGSNILGSNSNDIGNGWYRLSITVNDVINRVRLYPDFAQVNAGSIFIQDAQLEKGPRANKYIETTTSPVINADFSFTRGSAATRVTKDGLIKNVQILSDDLVQNGDFSQIGSELIIEGNWFNQDGAAEFYDNKIKINSGINGYLNRIAQPNILENNKTYRLTYEVLEDTGVSSFQYYNGSAYVDAPKTIGVHTIYYTKQGTTISFYLRVNDNVAGNYIVLRDNISIKEVGQNWTFGGEAIIDNGLVSFVSASNTYSYIRQDISSLSASLYRISVEVKNYVSGAVQVGFSGSSPNFQNLNVSANGVYTVELSPNANGDDLEVSREFGGGAFDFDIDNVSVIEVTDDTDLPRIDYTNGTGSLLLEPQSTNLITYSERFNEDLSNNRFNYRVTTVENSVISPSGNLNATSLIEDSTTNTHVMRNTVSITQNLTYTFSVFAKLKSGDRYLRLNLGTSNFNATFNLINKTVVGTTNAEGNIEEFENDWVRLSVTGTLTSSSYDDFDLRFINSSTNSDYYAGDGTSGFYVWGAQLEQQSYETSYIPTEGSTVTRNADACNNAGSSDLINSTEGVLYAEISVLNTESTARNISISDGSISNSVEIVCTSTGNFGFRIRANNVVEYLQTSALADATQFVKAAISYKSGDIKCFINGSEFDTDTTSFSFTNSLSELAFDRGNGQNVFQGNVRSIAVFKEALTDEELAKITSTTQQEVFYEMRDKMLQINADYYEFGDYTTRLKKLF